MMLRSGTINYNYHAGRSAWRTKLWYIKLFPNRVAKPPKHLFLRVDAEKQPPFPRALTPILQDKKHIDDQNQNNLQKSLLKLMPFWPEPRSDEWSFLSPKLSTLCFALINCIVASTNQVLPLLDQSGVAVTGPIRCCRCWPIRCCRCWSN